MVTLSPEKDSTTTSISPLCLLSAVHFSPDSISEPPKDLSPDPLDFLSDSAKDSAYMPDLGYIYIVSQGKLPATINFTVHETKSKKVNLHQSTIKYPNFLGEQIDDTFLPEATVTKLPLKYLWILSEQDNDTPGAMQSFRLDISFTGLLFSYITHSKIALILPTLMSPTPKSPFTHSQIALILPTLMSPTPKSPFTHSQIALMFFDWISRLQKHLTCSSFFLLTLL